MSRLSLLLFLLAALSSPPALCAVVYDVTSLGATPDGVTDSADAFLRAWSASCSSTSPATIYVPAATFLVSRADFSGPCVNSEIVFQIDGTIVAPSDYNVNGVSGYWIVIRSVSGVSVIGGVLDGRGAALWACKRAGGNCPTGATNLEFSNANNIFISGLKSRHSQMFHIVINACTDVNIQGVKVSAPENSPNTDGIHVQGSSNVMITNSRIGTGDDCISIGPGCSNMWIENIVCGPGHGISIGSLGKALEEDGVQHVTVSKVTFTGTQNGVRIKSWEKKSNGFARNILFQHARMINVQNPIIIDQHYCPFTQGCLKQGSGVQVSDVTYQDIHGTSATEVAVKLDCSSDRPCSKIKLENVKLMYQNQLATSSCSNAGGTALGFISATDCL
ncbi:hypothetical protein MLD38_016193 [Melastoma candidum]|uniref:Uncharacterized protein n=1 Tax=Melastoma candidum TaxID=119954 RepID=A0ACB9RJT2_9MYRT|nr:hypothetical protein MLD38_016193 [Melastoma candidum]